MAVGVGPLDSGISGRSKMDDAIVRIAAPGTDNSGAPSVLHAGDVAAVGVRPSPGKRRRSTARSPSNGRKVLGRHHRRKQSKCPAGSSHGCQTITGYYDGVCLVSLLNESECLLSVLLLRRRLVSSCSFCASDYLV